MQKVLVTDEWRMLPTYASKPAEELPMFAENRVHQRSSGNPYPCKIVAQVDRQHREERPFRVITLENEYLRLELMPELGGRIYAALDKRTGYDFFYRQHVIFIRMCASSPPWSVWLGRGCPAAWSSTGPATIAPAPLCLWMCPLRRSRAGPSPSG